MSLRDLFLPEGASPISHEVRALLRSNLRRDDGSIQRCHPHMLRDTFAVEMLLAGVPLEQVSILLGHKSVKITEKHHAPCVKARQEQLAANVRKAWNVLDTGNKTARRKSPKRVKSD